MKMYCKTKIKKCTFSYFRDVRKSLSHIPGYSQFSFKGPSPTDPKPRSNTTRPVPVTIATTTLTTTKTATTTTTTTTTAAPTRPSKASTQNTFLRIP